MDKAISASGLKTIKKCNLQYQFKYLTDIDGTKLSAGYMELGRAVHNAIETILNQREAVDISDQELVSDRLLASYSDNQEEVPEDMVETGEDCLELAAKHLSKNADVEIEDIEEWHYFDLENGSTSEEAVAVMDVCTDSEIWDWKTGKVRAHDEKIQGGIYALAYEEKYGKPPEAVKFIYLKEEKVRSLDPQEQDWSEVWDYVGQLKRAHALDEWPANPPEPCYFCSYEMFCSESPVGAGDIEWSQY